MDPFWGTCAISLPSTITRKAVASKAGSARTHTSIQQTLMEGETGRDLLRTGDMDTAGTKKEEF